jgi:hypothetical protein
MAASFNERVGEALARILLGAARGDGVSAGYPAGWSLAKCPLYPRTRTLSDTTGLSALCQKRTPALQDLR